MQKISLAVVGAGRMGQHHAKFLSQIESCSFEGVVDVDAKKSEKVAAAWRTKSYTNYQHLFGKVKGMVIAAPTPLHYSIGKDCLENGIHCLIEKPLCEKVEEAEELIQIAQNKNLILQVGHVERFNPAVIAAQKYIRDPKFIEVNRLGPYDPRVAHIGVVLDLMIHDLDIVLFLVNSKIQSLESFGAKVLSDYEDIVKCRLRFVNGCIVDLSASRISLEQYRRIRIFQSDAYLSLDYVHRELKVYRRKNPVIKSFNDIEILRPALKKEEPLKLELEHFIECLQEGKQPHVTGEHGRDAMDLGLEILQQLQLH